MTGAGVKDFSTTESNVVVETLEMPSGLYFVRLTSEGLNSIKKLQVVK
jgi:hypothetical protein